MSANWIGRPDYEVNGKAFTCIVARDGYDTGLKETYEKKKAKGECGGFIFVDVECKPISSTLIR